MINAAFALRSGAGATVGTLQVGVTKVVEEEQEPWVGLIASQQGALYVVKVFLIFPFFCRNS